MKQSEIIYLLISVKPLWLKFILYCIILRQSTFVYFTSQPSSPTSTKFDSCIYISLIYPKKKLAVSSIIEGIQTASEIAFARKRCLHDFWRFLNPSHPNINMHILHTVLNIFLKMLTRRICLTIKSFLRWW